jgi:CRISPR/Cas system-associated exonuclease Cas4 (RecB family)
MVNKHKKPRSKIGRSRQEAVDRVLSMTRSMLQNHRPHKKKPKLCSICNDSWPCLEATVLRDIEGYLWEQSSK